MRFCCFLLIFIDICSYLILFRDGFSQCAFFAFQFSSHSKNTQKTLIIFWKLIYCAPFIANIILFSIFIVVLSPTLVFPQHTTKSYNFSYTFSSKNPRSVRIKFGADIFPLAPHKITHNINSMKWGDKNLLFLLTFLCM